jgi:hypothetical protein
MVLLLRVTYTGDVTSALNNPQSLGKFDICISAMPHANIDFKPGDHAVRYDGGVS